MSNYPKHKRTPAANAPAGALDVWLRIPDGEEESEAEANISPLSSSAYLVEWCDGAVGLIGEHGPFLTYRAAAEWLESQGFSDFSA